ncbi:YegS/Rv2252/BmrU family lipid kinase [Tsukamurella sp. 8F]|uniref:diacylglycerol/lipid kinase family protein n=1 Tax=unclassified Tsukamurella TaxID=2633480 RepID=UPI0023B9219B|nr:MULTISPECIES: YegS/Rv2252/BmrU family lipid kinase [unclassified Tsukamurella]MDF0529162.1 YegS/Rv2252/BmrU family lipid kinase [Tsukamurella sp. 8J]MDF0585347.1 YegS/Rv2252/BmrU family lipid kinase [Tsukamurella sp. 8F]
MTAEVVGIANPVSGGGAARMVWPALEAALTARGVDARIIWSSGAADAADAAEAAAREGAQVVAVGGDGQIRVVAEGLSRVPGAALGIAPAGRGNDLARHLGLPHDAVALADVLCAGTRRTVDTVDVGGMTVLGNVYAGLDSLSTELINRLRSIGTAAYRLAPVLAALRWRPARFTVTVDGETLDLAAHMVVVANSGDYGHGLRMVPSADVGSGRLEILVVRGDHSKYRLANLMGQARTGAHVGRPEVLVLSGTTVTVAADRPVPVHADGDYLTELPFTAVVRPGTLDVIVPPMP